MHRAAPRPADTNVMNSVNNQNFMFIDARDWTSGMSSPVAPQYPIRHKAIDDEANDSVFSNDDFGINANELSYATLSASRHRQFALLDHSVVKGPR
jgi:hypothetical protein